MSGTQVNFSSDLQFSAAAKFLLESQALLLAGSQKACSLVAGSTRNSQPNCQRSCWAFLQKIRQGLSDLAGRGEDCCELRLSY